MEAAPEHLVGGQLGKLSGVQQGRSRWAEQEAHPDNAWNRRTAGLGGLIDGLHGGGAADHRSQRVQELRLPP